MLQYIGSLEDNAATDGLQALSAQTLPLRPSTDRNSMQRHERSRRTPLSTAPQIQQRNMTETGIGNGFNRLPHLTTEVLGTCTQFPQIAVGNSNNTVTKVADLERTETKWESQNS